jgi:hypothetical protein
MFAREKEDTVVTARRIAIAEIDRAVASRLGPTRVMGNAQPAVFNRQVAMYLAKALGGWSVTKIGKFYNGRHHTTVCHAIQRIASLRQVNADVDSLLTVVTAEIQSGIESKPRRPLPLLRRPTEGQLASAITEELAIAVADRVIAGLMPRLHEILKAQSYSVSR